jgi:ubiquinone/menaquinone biosynthesis C-methylase UbiE
MPTTTIETKAQPAATGAPANTAAQRLASESARLLATDLDRLNFGCGDHPLPGWVNIDGGDGAWYDAPARRDVVALDLFDALDVIPAGSASFVYSEHLFEHFTLQQGHALLAEWFRVLKPGGVVRIVTPDLAGEAKFLLRQVQPAPEETIDAHRRRWLGHRCPLRPGEQLTRAINLNYGMWLDGHKFLYDYETLEQSLRLAGFESIVRERYGHSRHDALRGIDRHDGAETGGEWLTSQALIVEATRPRGATATDGARLRDTLAAAGRPPAHAIVAPSGPQADPVKLRMIDAAAVHCAQNGWRRIALYGAGRHTPPIIRQPWKDRDVQVVAVLDDYPRTTSIRGVPVMTPDQLTAPIDAVVISSDAHEPAIYERAAAFFGPRNVSVVRIYDDPDRTASRLVAHWGVREADARWLMDNRFERHDATLPMLPAERTELHLRRYEFAADAGRLAGLRVLDAACGTGYGSKLLRTLGDAASVTGVDICPEATAYAARRHAAAGVRFVTAGALKTGLPDASVEAVVTFETVEHIRESESLVDEFARVLAPGGLLIISTPNDTGLTEHHVHSFTRGSLQRLLHRRFHQLDWFGQHADAPVCGLPAAGIAPIDHFPPETKPDFLIAVARLAPRGA